MTNWKTMAKIRREYGDLSLNEETIHQCPLKQFKLWFEEVCVEEKTDPTAMVLSTVDKKGHPDSRVVLLKGINGKGFIFYTNYQSAKGLQIKHNPYAALNFYWPQMSRQVRIRGKINFVSKNQSDIYFASRPQSSQLSALISPQSQIISTREELITAFQSRSEQTQPISRPKHWGGYVLIPKEIEFWQGRNNRLHDRILYFKKKGIWVNCRLAP